MVYGSYEDKPDWAGKERRMVRMNSNTNAVASVLVCLGVGGWMFFL